MRIYLIGKMRGEPHWGFPAFDAAKERLVERGFDVVSPADLDRAAGFDGTADVLPENFLCDAMARDLAALIECDGVALLPRWEKSELGKVEVHLALKLNKRVVDAATGGFILPSEAMDRLVKAMGPEAPPVVVPVETVLEEANRITSADRKQQYGDAKDHFKRTVGLINVRFGHILTRPLEPCEWGLIMILDKLARNDDTRGKKRDDFVDVAGYARLASDLSKSARAS